MFTKSRTFSVNAPPEAVFAYVSDVTRHGEWSAWPLEVVVVEGAPSGVGSIFTSTVRKMGGIPAQGRVVALEAPASFAYECSDSSGTYSWFFRLEPEGAGTRLTYGFDRLAAPLFIRLVQPWLMWPLLGNPSLNRTIANLKARCEASA